ncbi:MAG: hypothetical protein SGJ27_19530 [Candidatus Melainabacteria bacterium]|nr:hypothetical protein [Candidatus Melainabacteria bacterium]
MDRNETMIGFYRDVQLVKSTLRGRSRGSKSVSLKNNGATVSNRLETLMAGLTLIGVIAVVQPAVTYAADSGSVPTSSSEGWESPVKLKPYVKFQPDAVIVPSTAPSSSIDPSATPVLVPATTPSGTPVAVPGTIGTPGTVTIKKETIEVTTPHDANQKEIDSVVKSIILDGGPDVLRVRTDRKAAKRLAKYHWLDKAAAANPQVIEAITMYSGAAKLLAKHPRLSEIADADHYVCRRITKWKSAARVLAANGEVKEVAAFDPEGLYVAIKKDRKIVRILSRNPIFDQMIVENPDLARVISKYM